jgi:hypothetical protein
MSKINQPNKNDIGQRLICQTIRWKIIEWTFPYLSCWNHSTAIVQRQAQGYAVALRPGDVT